MELLVSMRQKIVLRSIQLDFFVGVSVTGPGSLNAVVGNGDSPLLIASIFCAFEADYISCGDTQSHSRTFHATASPFPFGREELRRSRRNPADNFTAVSKNNEQHHCVVFGRFTNTFRIMRKRSGSEIGSLNPDIGHYVIFALPIAACGGRCTHHV